MSERSTWFLNRGMMEVSAGPAALSTVVGAGYAVAIWLAGKRGGGLVHVDTGGSWSPVGEAAGAEVWDRLAEFLARLEGFGSIYGAQAEIIGGADVLHLLPTLAHQAIAQGWIAALSDFLSGHGVGVQRTVVQGNCARRVVLHLPDGGVEVTTAGGAPASGRVTPRPRAPANDDAETGRRSGRTDRDVMVDIGGMQVGEGPARLVTVLGSCVGIALWDAASRIGGLAHVVLPRANGSADQDSRFADTAVPALVQALVAAGAARGRLEAKIAGGASVIFARDAGRLRRISEENVTAVRQALDEARIPLLGEDVGGEVGRRMVVDLASFDVRIVPLRREAGG